MVLQYFLCYCDFLDQIQKMIVCIFNEQPAKAYYSFLEIKQVISIKVITVQLPQNQSCTIHTKFQQIMLTYQKDYLFLYEIDFFPIQKDNCLYKYSQRRMQMFDLQSLFKQEAGIKDSLMQIEKSIQQKEIGYIKHQWQEGNIRTGWILDQQKQNKIDFKSAHNISTKYHIFSLSSLTSPVFQHLTDDIDQLSMSQVSISTKRKRKVKDKYKHKKIIKISRRNSNKRSS